MSAERLIKEFSAQDVGAWLNAVIDGVHTRVAQWNNANSCWDVLPAGHKLLNPVHEEEAVVEEKPKAPRKPKAVERVGFAPAGELSLD